MSLLGTVREDWHRRRTFRRWRRLPEVSRRIAEVLALNAAEVGQSVTASDPRSLPSNPDFVASGWTEHMLLRYLSAFDHARGKQVLDSCCGLGWGAHLVASQARHVVGIDLDTESIDFCRRRWGSGNAEFVVGSVLDLPFSEATFDVVLSMEAIEHFSVADGRRYLQELARVCRPGGALVGSSAFPETPEQADRRCSRNEHHLHIYTRREIGQLFRDVFGPVAMLTRHYFVVRRAR